MTLPGTETRVEHGLLGRAALVLGPIGVAIGVFTIGPVMPRIGATFAQSPLAWLVLWIGSIGAPAFAVGSPAAGVLVARLGYRLVFLGSILGWVAAGVIPFLSSNLWLVLISRVLVGLAAAGAMTASLDGIAQMPEQQRPTLFGLQAVAGSLAAMGAIPLVGVLARGNWQNAFAIYGVGLLLVPLILALPKVPAQAPRKTGGAGQVLAGVPPFTILFAASVGVTMLVAHVVTGFYLVSIGVPATKTSIPLTAMSFASMVAAFFYGRIHRRAGTAGTFCLATLVIAAGLIVCATSGSLASFIAGTLLLGSGLPNCIANLYTAASAGREAAHGPALGVVNGAIYIAPVLLPLTIRPATAHLGAGGIFLVLAGLMLVASAAFAVQLLTQRASPVGAETG